MLCVARQYPRKRIGDLLYAAAWLRPRIPAARIRIVGRGPEWAPLVRLHGALGLGERVALLGDISRERLAEEYANADCFCLPSVQEGFGVVFVEAMAAGLPVVACQAAAVPEVVLDGQTGVLVPPRDPRGAGPGAGGSSEATRERARERGEAGRRRAAELTPTLIAERFLDAVRSHIGEVAPT